MLHSKPTVTSEAPIQPTGGSVTTPATPAISGKRLGAFEVGALLGEGGMGSVFGGRDVALDRQVAIKVLHAKLAADGEFVERFVREARTAAKLNHTNVVQIYGAGYEEGTAYMALELVTGCSLFDLYKAQRPFPPRRACELIRDVARGLSVAHDLGIVHRDIKPENILITEQGVPKLADFGLARASNQRITETGVFLGTPQYASPEQCNAMELTPASDLYSLGVVLYELLAGRPPYEAPTPLTLFKKILMEPPRPLSESCPDLPPSLFALIDRLLHKEPERRYASAAALVADLERVLPSLAAVAGDADPYALIAVARADSRTIQVQHDSSNVLPFQETGTTPLALPPSAAPSAEVSSLERAQKGLFFLALALLCVVIGLFAYKFRAGGPNRGGGQPIGGAPAVQAPLRVAVIPWINRAKADDFAWLEQALPDFLVTQLGQRPDAITVEPLANVGDAAAALDLTNPSERRKLAQALGVDLIIGGSFYVTPDGQVALNARVETPDGTPRKIPGSPAIFAKAEVLSALNRFAETLAAALAGPGADLTKLASAASDDEQALADASAGRQVDRVQGALPPAAPPAAKPAPQEPESTEVEPAADAADQDETQEDHSAAAKPAAKEEAQANALSPAQAGSSNEAGNRVGSGESKDKKAVAELEKEITRPRRSVERAKTMTLGKLGKGEAAGAGAGDSAPEGDSFGHAGSARPGGDDANAGEPAEAEAPSTSQAAAPPNAQGAAEADGLAAHPSLRLLVQALAESNDWNTCRALFACSATRDPAVCERALELMAGRSEAGMTGTALKQVRAQVAASKR